MQFQKPDEKTQARMTVASLSALIGSLRKQREDIVKPYDEQLLFYKKLLDQKKEASATASR